MTHRIRKLRYAFITLSMIAVAIAPAVVLAGTQNSGGCGSDTTYLRLWENPSGDTSDGNDSMYQCGNVSNLSAISFDISGSCHGPFWFNDNWNDCIDSFTYWGPGNQYACFYKDYNYVGFVDHRGTNEQGVRYDIAYSPTDVLSSVRWDTTSPYC
jgi:hypothetical protein